MVCEKIFDITERIAARSHHTRQRYLSQLKQDSVSEITRKKIGCSNLAHSFAACSSNEKHLLSHTDSVSVGIVTSYNDMLSAHQPYESYPELLRQTAGELGAVAQVAGGVPAMCDGITQGESGMELSLFSRDVIAMSTAVALSHKTFDTILYLGVCDKIVPGLVMGALAFGHLPGVFVPAGPMPSGIPNDTKAKIRKEYATGTITSHELLAAESASYHAPGTCTFYGTANSNQLLMEVMGLHIPRSTFVPPNTTSRVEYTIAALKRAIAIARQSSEYLPLGLILDEKAFVNGMVALNATGGSTNHTIHLIAMAKIAGIILEWRDFADISEVVPLLARVYPNGHADINHFRDSGGVQFVISELLQAGLLHPDVQTVNGFGLADYCNLVCANTDESVLRPFARPFQHTGGIKLLTGNLGNAIIKVSAVRPEHQVITAPARVFDSQGALQDAFEAGNLRGDFVAVVRFQGPKANGMPELHKLTPALSVLQDNGQKVALVTDGRMSGASGRIAAAIHVTPEAADSPNLNMLSRIQDGDIITLDATQGVLNVHADVTSFLQRVPAVASTDSTKGTGRELFANFRRFVGPATEGALSCC